MIWLLVFAAGLAVGYAIREWRAIDRDAVHENTRSQLELTQQLLDAALTAAEIAQADAAHWRGVARPR